MSGEKGSEQQNVGPSGEGQGAPLQARLSVCPGRRLPRAALGCWPHSGKRFCARARGLEKSLWLPSVLTRAHVRMYTFLSAHPADPRLLTELPQQLFSRTEEP